METFEHTINATGEILPEFEDIITSPINVSIQSVTIDVGTPVKAGDLFLPSISLRLKMKNFPEFFDLFLH